jgi:hypothetical protein
VAGHGRPEGGRALTWTLAEGSRGRRWRSATYGASGRLEQALLLEVSPANRIGRLELSSAVGLLTLHPEPAGQTLHGNVASAAGMLHVALPWSADHQLLVAGSPITAAVAAARLRESVGVGEGRSIPAVTVDRDLAIAPATWRVARVGESRWRFVVAGDGPGLAVELDRDGAPVIAGGERWPLELDA